MKTKFHYFQSVVTVIFIFFFCFACQQEATNYPNSVPSDQISDLIIRGATTRFQQGPHADLFECENCHHEAGDSSTWEVSWLDPTGYYVEVFSSTELCLKCHLEYTNSEESNNPELAHSDFGCEDCHDPHRVTAGCDQPGCHLNVQEIMFANIAPPEGHTTDGNEEFYTCGGSGCHPRVTQIAAEPIYHQPVHKSVSCPVCHDASGLEISVENTGLWVTTLPGELDEHISHAISTQVGCLKCHHQGNPWGLVQLNSD
jgi:hypothetical protein